MRNPEKSTTFVLHITHNIEFMETISINPQVINSLKKEVFDHLSYVRILLKDPSFMGKAIDQLNTLLLIPEEQLFEGINEAYNRTMGLSKIVLTNSYNCIHLRYSDIAWELVYLFAYFSFSKDRLWQEQFFPRMKNLLPKLLQQEAEQGENKINTFISQREQLAQMVRECRNAEPRRVIDSDKPTVKDLEDTFSYVFRKSMSYSLFIEDLLNDRQNAEDADWARDALDIYDHWKKFLKKKPATFIAWLHTFCDIFGREWVRDYEPKKLKATNKTSTILKYVTAD